MAIETMDITTGVTTIRDTIMEGGIGAEVTGEASTIIGTSAMIVGDTVHVATGRDPGLGLAPMIVEMIRGPDQDHHRTTDQNHAARVEIIKGRGQDLRVIVLDLNQNLHQRKLNLLKLQWRRKMSQKPRTQNLRQ